MLLGKNAVVPDTPRVVPDIRHFIDDVKKYRPLTRSAAVIEPGAHPRPASRGEEGASDVDLLTEMTLPKTGNPHDRNHLTIVGKQCISAHKRQRAVGH